MHFKRIVVLSACLTISAALPLSAPAQKAAPVATSASDGTSAYADGTITLRDLTLPPSSYWSPQFKAAFAKTAAYIVAHRSYEQPRADAPVSEWKKYDLDCEKHQSESLSWQKQNYPVTVMESHIGGVHVATVTPQGGVSPENSGRVLIELHGGSCGGLDGLTEAIPVAHFGRIRVVSVDYSAAPRTPYPGSLLDVVRVYKALAKTHRPSQIGIFGTSGGGMLVSEALAQLQHDGLPRPGAAGIFWSGIMGYPYPFGKFGDSELWEGGGIPHSDHTQYRQLIDQLSQSMKAVPIDDPVAYPLSSPAMLRGFPPILFLTGTRALDQSAVVSSHARLLQLGVSSSLFVMEGGWHAASYSTFGSPEEAEVNTYIGKWFSGHLSR